MRRTNAIAPATATAPATTTTGSVQPRGPASVSDNVADASVITAIAAPTTSRARAAWTSRVSGIAYRAHTTTTAATGRLIRNAHRQPGPSTSQPPRNGPIAPATPPSPDHAPTARL